ncbi:hypothetical protein DL89DRAFT_260162 [Linderina pennispora]|uniref:Uncharacterized protein n=1 Tax=Linderina pennispora TaxID=61395 RepID=A0A1Y1VZ30_9FUNG|nr:uncharacterized protein DL89DRAFT_260162 [Linderina pennispora]ORX66519.1 hypothetical protein DL89DRAFT_260162 [Linderina pennispora]
MQKLLGIQRRYSSLASRCSRIKSFAGFNQAQPDIEYLQRLARGLYTGLCNNQTLNNPRYKGTGLVTVEGEPEGVNPFAERISMKGTIVSDLLEIMEKAWRDSMMVVKALADSDA